jgi:hypothetical protein
MGRKSKIVFGVLFVLGLLAALVLRSLSPMVTSHYGTYSEAAADHLFGRGWLPEFIPSSSFNITASNDLDFNTSEGEFMYQLKDTEQFISKLQPYGGRKAPFENYKKTVDNWKARGYMPYEYVNEGFVWVFFINRERSHTYYDLWMERKGS